MPQGFQETRLVLEAEGLQLPAVLTVPDGGAVGWAILLIPGSRAIDENGNYPDLQAYPHMLMDLAQQLSVRGHAVLRYAKRGAPGTVVVDEAQAAARGTFPQQQHIAAAACAKLRELVPHAKGLILAGHSEGSVHGTMLAQQPALKVDGLVCLSGPAWRFLDLFVQVAEKMRDQQGDTLDFGSFAVNADLYIRAFPLMRAQQPLTAEMRADSGLAAFADGLVGDPGSPQAAYVRDYDTLVPYEELAKVPCPVLVVQGGMDQSAVLPENAGKLVEARRDRHPMTTTLAFFPDLNHYYKHEEPGLTAQASMRLDSESDPRVADAIAAWLEGLTSGNLT